MRSDQALRYIKNFMREIFLEYDRMLWQKDKIPQAVNEMVFYLSKCNEEDKQSAWVEICKHARFSERLSDKLSAENGNTTLLQ